MGPAVVALIVTGLASVVTAAPPRTTLENGTAISIIKSRTYLNPDNSIDFDALNFHIDSVYAKIYRGFKNYAMNGTDTNPHTPTSWVKKRGAGFVVFDTATADFFLPVDNCDETCRDHTLYFPDRSTTSHHLTEPCNIAYSDGSLISGEWYADNVVVSVSNLLAVGQVFCAAKTYSPPYQLSRFQADGVIGLAFPSISSSGASPVFQTLFDQGRVTVPAFSFKLRDPGELYVGGLNSALYTGSIVFVPLILTGFWLVEMDNIMLGDQPFVESVPAIIDTGSIIIVGPTAQVTVLQSYLGGIPAPSLGDGFYIFPCNYFRAIGFSFGGKTSPIPSESLSLGRTASASPFCISAFVGQDLIEGRSVWVLGTPFLESVYSTFSFDATNPQVGFATLA